MNIWEAATQGGSFGLAFGFGHRIAEAIWRRIRAALSSPMDREGDHD